MNNSKEENNGQTTIQEQKNRERAAWTKILQENDGKRLPFMDDSIEDNEPTIVPDGWIIDGKQTETSW